jgi:hypothetical protein
MSVDGITFDPAWQNRQQAHFDGIQVWMISLPDLVRNKTASGRLQDQLNLENLRLSNQREKPENKKQGPA